MIEKIVDIVRDAGEIMKQAGNFLPLPHKDHNAAGNRVQRTKNGDQSGNQCQAAAPSAQGDDISAAQTVFSCSESHIQLLQPIPYCQAC